MRSAGRHSERFVISTIGEILLADGNVVFLKFGKVLIALVGAVALLSVHTPAGLRREGRYTLQSGLGWKVTLFKKHG
ncbi:hypothetical protein ACFSJU_17475 [Paradesertivirga mongoliensis]|uniref:Uncharacterized protein n=1 Tax=Paradesertivirga mongoliensis TaxID=2100740 RepID=A0ABW4ZQT7_9SPHI|nr:hypothetical protein [Pedobacter mongoliensis]